MGCGGCLGLVIVVGAWVLTGPILGLPALALWLVAMLAGGGGRKRTVVEHRHVVRYEEPPRAFLPPPEVCHHCGAEIAATAAFCQRCGKPTFLV